MERFAIKIDKNLRANLYKICRLCGIDNPDKIKVRDDKNIVNLEDGEPELWKKVFDCIGLMITKDDKMPQFMCTLCVDKINDFFEFREMCYATDVQTRKLLGIKKEPKAKAPPTAPVQPAVDFKTEDIKEPIAELTPQRGRKRRNADLDICRDIKTDESEDIKPPTTNVAGTSNASKKKRLRLSPEAETKLEPGAKPKKEPLSKVTPKLERTPKIPLSKKRLKTEPVVKITKKDIKATKLSKLMTKKLKLETPAASVVPEEQLQQLTKKKKELVKLKKLPQVLIKKNMLDTKIKEETSDAAGNNEAAPSTKSTKSLKSKDACTICDESFVSKIHLAKHVKQIHIPSVSRYHCVQCNETLKKNMEIKNHNLWHKLSKTPFKCGNCSEACCSIYTYSKHIRDCNQIAYLDSHIPDWHCPDCGGNYETTYLFNIHSCVAKGLVCPGCEKPFKWKEDYLKHIPTCPAAFHQIPPYMTSNIQVKNEAELPTSPIPPLTTATTPSLPTSASSMQVQTTPSSRTQPPLMDSNQCVVIPGNISFPVEAGSASPSKSSRKGKRITKKDLKRFDKLLKSTMTTLVSIKHEPNQGVDDDDDDNQSTSTDMKERGERTSPAVSEPNSRSHSPMAFGGDDDFHHNGDDSDSADDQAPTKPVGKIKQEIIDEGYRDLYNNIEVNIKHEVSGETAVPKPILKLKITKEHGTLNSILVDSPISEKKKKKKKRKEDRANRMSPAKEELNMQLPTTEVVENSLPTVALPTTQNLLPECNKTSESTNQQLPEVMHIKKEPGVDLDDGAPSQNTPSIVASSSGSLQISCVSEGVTFHDAEQNEEEMPQHASADHEEFTNWAEPTPSMELSLNPMPADNLAAAASSIQLPANEEEIDVKPRLEDLIPMLKIASVTSEAEPIEKSTKTPVKRKRRTNAAKCNQMPKILSISSGAEVDSFNSPLNTHSTDDVGVDMSSEENTPAADTNAEAFDFNQVKIKEEIFDPGYDKEDTLSPPQDEKDEHDTDDNEAEDEEPEEDLQRTEVSQKQVEENAYIANIDFNNLVIKQEKEYIDDGLENAVAFEEDEADDVDSENDSEDSTSDTDEDEEDDSSESEREYRDLPSADEDEGKESDETMKSKAKKTEEAPLALQNLKSHNESCIPESTNKKTESENNNSDPKLHSNTTECKAADLIENKGNEQLAMDIDGHETNHEAIFPKESGQSGQMHCQLNDQTFSEMASVSQENKNESSKAEISLKISAVVSESHEAIETQISDVVSDGFIGIAAVDSLALLEPQINETPSLAASENELPAVNMIPKEQSCENVVELSNVASPLVHVEQATVDSAMTLPLTDPDSEIDQELSLSLENEQNCQTPAVEQNHPILPQPVAENAQQISSESVENSSNLPQTLETALSYSTDGPIRIDDNIQHSNHIENTSQSSNPLLELNHSLSNVDQSFYHDTQNFNILTSQTSTAAAAFNIPPPPTTTSQMENLQHEFNLPGSSFATTTYNSEYQDLSLPTAGQLQTSFVHHHHQHHPNTSQSDALLPNLQSLSEEVQNLLNEETVAVNNFEYNDCVLRARNANLEALPIPRPVFNDFENLNEIAENNNNANIERELQDELGNVLGDDDVIADRSNDDNDTVDQNNVMNENRANFDIT